MTYETIMPTVRSALREALLALEHEAEEDRMYGSEPHEALQDAINSVKHALRLAGEK